MGRIVLMEGDIASQEVDAIVNAANSSLLLGSGVAVFCVVGSTSWGR